MAQGLITRGLFHEAALNIFSVLILYWKKFCLVRFAPKRQRSAIKSASSLYHMKRQEWPGQGATGHEEHREWHAFFGGKSLSLSLSYTKLRNLGYIILFQCLFDIDGGPILSYSLSHGIRWLYPGANQHYHIEHHQQNNDSNTVSEQQSQMLTI